MYEDIKDNDGKVIKTKADQEKEHDESIARSKAESLRAERNKLLQETDKYALSDRTLSEQMKINRQKLRDLPKDTAGWPDIEIGNFPTKPTE